VSASGFRADFSPMPSPSIKNKITDGGAGFSLSVIFFRDGFFKRNLAPASIIAFSEGKNEIRTARGKSANGCFKNDFQRRAKTGVSGEILDNQREKE
jgi:hypothetical protein